ncbi:MAG: hypothetical protein LBC04_00120 [Holosporaceae bacterium]|jgi:hypothetical protein|nr:hypothetical protein [Holosporaceae bacterium]
MKKLLLMTTVLTCWHSVDAMRPQMNIDPDDVGSHLLQLQTQSAEFSRFHSEHTRRFDEHTGRFEEHDRRLAEGEETAISQDRYIARLQAELRQKTQQLDDFARRFQSFEETFRIAQERQADSDRKIAAMEANLGRREARMADLRAMEGRLAAAETKMQQYKALLISADEKVKINSEGVYHSTLIRGNGISGSIENGGFKGNVSCDGVIIIGNGHLDPIVVFSGGHLSSHTRSLQVNGRDIYRGSSLYDICQVKRNDEIEAHGVNFIYYPVQ